MDVSIDSYNIGRVHGRPTLDSNQSWKRTMCGCFNRCSICSSSYTICSLPLTFFFRMILTATLPAGQSASRTTPYVPAPKVRPNLYCDLDTSISSWCQVMRAGFGDALLVVALWLPVQFVDHIRDCDRSPQLVSPSHSLKL